jgi:hypothetical protein
MYSAPAAFAASITLICCAAELGLWPVTMKTRFAPASAFAMAARSSSSAIAILALDPSTSFALSALRTIETGFSPRVSSSFTTARPVFPVAPTTAYITILHGARGAPYDIRYTHQRLDASTAIADGRARSMLPLPARFRRRTR